MDQSQVLRFLPDVFRRTVIPGGPLEALTEAMVAMLDPVDRRLSVLEWYFDPYRTPSAMLPYLASWVDMGWLAIPDSAEGGGVPPERLRRLIAMSPFFAKHRGTTLGLETILRVATGVPAIRVLDSMGDPPVRPFHLVVQLPKAASFSRPLVELIVRFEKPAYLTHDVTLLDEP